MAEYATNLMVNLVRQVKSAIRRAEDRQADRKLAVIKVDLEIKTVLKKEIGAGGKISWLPVPIELSAKHKQVEIQTITLTLIPEPSIVLMGTVSDELSEAIEVIRNGVEEAATSQPPYHLKEAVIAINFGTTSDGKVQVIVGGGAEVENAHLVKLTMGPAK